MELNRTISPNDQMFAAGREDHYFSVGTSAIDCIRCALLAAKRTHDDIKQILDLPCGHGRVLRHLALEFPQAKVTACDLLRDGVDFCAQVLGAVPVYSHEEPGAIPLPRNNFDLIWVGSLMTHFEHALWPKFLDFFRSCLSPKGVLAFTTHGRRMRQNMVENHYDYALPRHLRADLLFQYEQTGFGYIHYVGSDSYGVSLSSVPWVCQQILKVPDFQLVHISEMAWDDHQDLFACMRQEW